jgi:hypothetical protein
MHIRIVENVKWIHANLRYLGRTVTADDETCDPAPICPPPPLYVVVLHPVCRSLPPHVALIPYSLSSPLYVDLLPYMPPPLLCAVMLPYMSSSPPKRPPSTLSRPPLTYRPSPLRVLLHPYMSSSTPHDLLLHHMSSSPLCVVLFPQSEEPPRRALVATSQ